jgi:HNH endonuclease/AP2 domain
MAYRPDITPELLRQLLTLDEATGDLFWKERPVEYFYSAGIARAWNERYAGTAVGQRKHGRGYQQIDIMDKKLFVHRVVFTLVHGRWPKQTVDHINCIKSDNRPVNLREASYSENNRNVGPSKANTSGIRGVSWIKKAQKWQVEIHVEGERKYLGSFADKDEAAQAYAAASIEYHKEFRHQP